MDYGALDRAIAELVNGGRQVRIIEELSERKEKDFLDENDKIEQMTVEVLPDDTVSQEEMNEYGYLWYGMLPLLKETAERLYKQGLDIYRLYGDDTQKPIDADSELYEHEGLFGIEKPNWILHTESKNEEAVPMAADVPERKSYMELFRESVEKEYKAFYAEEMQKPKEDLITAHIKYTFLTSCTVFSARI